MMPIPDTARLAGLIGRELDWLGRRCRIVEVLVDGPALVLEPLAAEPAIQQNQYGEATRRAVEVHTVALLNPRGDGPNPMLAGLPGLLATL